MRPPHARIKRPLLPLWQHAVRKAHRLDYLFFEITQRCQLACLHCGSDCSVGTGEPDLPLEAALRVADSVAAAFDARKITAVITGGEPILHPQVFELGAALAQRGFSWGLVSNGWAWTPELAQRAREAGMRAATISLDGQEAEHDWLRGRRGSHQRALRTLRLLLRSPAIPGLDAVTCVNQRNLGQLSQLHELLCGLGLRRWRLFTIDPIGRAAQLPELLLEREQFHQLMRFIMAQRRDSPMRVDFSCGAYLGPRLENQVRTHDYLCVAGIEVGGVMVNGDILACPNNDRSLAQGNVFRDDFVRIWRERFGPFRDRRWMRQGRCLSCDQWRWCHGNDMHLWDPEAQRTRLCHFHEYGLADFEP